MLSTQSQLLMRNIEHFEVGKWAFVNPTEATIFDQVQNENLVGLHQFYTEYEACKQASTKTHVFSAAFSLKDDEEAFDGAVIYMPKSKQQLAMLIDNLSAMMKLQSTLIIVGENKAGIKSVPKLLEKVGEQVNKIDSAKHCGLYAVTVTKQLKNFDINNYSVTKNYEINEQNISVFSLPGVFGHKQLDPGTNLLLKQLNSLKIKNKKPHIYDFACGTGVIGCYMAKQLEASEILLSMSDVSALAIYCSQESAKLNNVDANIIASNGFAELNKKVDVIVSNPPFHTGIKNDYSVTENFINSAYSHSNQYASITVVANKFLPYPDMLEKTYKGFSELASTPQYRVYHAKKHSK